MPKSITATPSGSSRPSRRRATSLPKPSSRCHVLPMPAIRTCLGRDETSGSCVSSGASGAGGRHVSFGGSMRLASRSILAHDSTSTSSEKKNRKRPLSPRISCIGSSSIVTPRCRRSSHAHEQPVDRRLAAVEHLVVDVVARRPDAG